MSCLAGAGREWRHGTLRNPSAYAKQLMVTAGVTDTRIQQAFATVPRELFLGPGPWKIGSEDGTYLETPSRDPAHVYTDSVISLVPERAEQWPAVFPCQAHGARCAGIRRARRPRRCRGRVLRRPSRRAGRSRRACHSDRVRPRARTMRQAQPCALVAGGADSRGRLLSLLQTADVIYVSAGATRPAEAWLDRLAERRHRWRRPKPTRPGNPLHGVRFETLPRGRCYLRGPDRS